MWKEIALFEWKYQIRRPITWILFILLLGITLFIYAAMGGIMGKVYTSPPNTSGKVWLNSAYVIMSFMATASLIALTMIPAIFGNAALRDFRYRTDPLSLSLPLSKKDYFFGHFGGAMLIGSLVLASIPFGVFVASILPGMDIDRFGPIRLWSFLSAYLFILLPNLFFMGAFFYSLAISSRKMVLSYVGGILLFIAYAFALSLVTSDNAFLASISEPFAAQAIIHETQYWTPIEQSEKLVPIQGHLLWNRILWIFIGIIILTMAFSRFQMEYKEG